LPLHWCAAICIHAGGCTRLTAPERI
jgi:hypothetical protein